MEEPVYTRRNPAPFVRTRATRITVPERACPVVRLLFEEMKRQNVSYDDVEDRTGVKRVCLKAWRYKNRPNLDTIEAALSAVGFEFVPVPMARALPHEVVEALQPAAEALRVSLAEAVRLTAEIAYRDHHLAAINEPT